METAKIGALDYLPSRHCTIWGGYSRAIAIVEELEER